MRKKIRSLPLQICSTFLQLYTIYIFLSMHETCININTRCRNTKNSFSIFFSRIHIFFYAYFNLQQTINNLIFMSYCHTNNKTVLEPLSIIHVSYVRRTQTRATYCIVIYKNSSIKYFSLSIYEYKKKCECVFCVHKTDN